MLVLFIIAYYLDKYNLIFVYPIEFDSQVTNREALAKFSILGVIYFQALMLLYLSANAPVQFTLVFAGALVLQIFFYLFWNRSGRKPW